MAEALPRPRMMPRDGAGSMELTGGTGAVMHLIGLPGFMEIYKIDATFQAQTPDNIDPCRTNPDVPWAWKITDDAGCQNPAVARVFIQCAEALKNVRLLRGNQERIGSALHAVKTEIRHCEKAFRRLAAQHDKIQAAIRAAGGLQVEKRVVNGLPGIPNLQEEGTLFITSAKRALQHVAEVLNEFYGTTVNNARFDIGRKQLKALHPLPKEQLECLEFFAATINRILSLRNSQDHTPKETVIEDFHLTAVAIQPPTWRVKSEPETPMLPEMRDIIAALIELTEVSFFHGLMDNLDSPPGPFGYQLLQIPEDQRDKDCPMRFRCELQFAQPPSSEPLTSTSPV